MNIELAEYFLKDLTRSYRRTINWHAKVDAWRAGTGPEPMPRSMPSKSHKHQMYAKTISLMATLRITDIHPSNLDQIGQLIERAADRIAEAKAA